MITSCLEQGKTLLGVCILATLSLGHSQVAGQAVPCDLDFDCITLMVYKVGSLTHQNDKLARRLSELETTVERFHLSELAAIERDIAAAHTRLNYMQLTVSNETRLPPFGCGQSTIAPNGLHFMVGYRDGTKCGIPNDAVVRTLRLVVPPRE